MPSRQPSGQSGFTVVELLVAIAILLVGVLGTVALLDGANAATAGTAKREDATNLARQVVEATKGVSYSSTTQGAIVGALQTQTGLGDSDGGTPGWQISRRGVVYTVALTACAIDDPRDNLGTHDSSFCSDSAAWTSGTVDSAPDDYRRVTLDVSWSAGSRTAHSRQTTLVTKRGTGAAAPATSSSISITGCTPADGCDSTALGVGQISTCYVYFPSPYTTYCAPISGTGIYSCTTYKSVSGVVTYPTCATSVSFQVTTTGSPASVKWALDGTDQGNAAGSANTWTFSWSLGSTYPQTPVDGVYEITAQAYDAAGARSGSPITKTVTLNRLTPDITAFSLLAGRNDLFSLYPEVELFPTASTGARLDRDIIGYLTERYWRGTNAQGKLSGPTQDETVCSLQTTTWCQDAAPPTLSSPAWYQLQVVPYDRAPDGEARAGDGADCDGGDPPVMGCSRNVVLANTRPNPPSGLTISSSGGQTTLSWTLPSGTGDPDSGDYVDRFRIYRDGTLVSSRYDSTPFGTSASGGTSTSYVDTATGGTTHTYRITSVDTRLAESTMVGPVTG